MEWYKTPAYRSTEELSRICPVCSSAMVLFSDGFDKIVKCMSCGYSKRASGGIRDQHFYDRPVKAAAFLTKRGYYELYEPLDEQLYNAMMTDGWQKTEVIRQIIDDLRLTGAKLDHFLKKVDNLL